MAHSVVLTVQGYGLLPLPLHIIVEESDKKRRRAIYTRFYSNINAHPKIFFAVVCQDHGSPCLVLVMDLASIFRVSPVGKPLFSTGISSTCRQ